MRTMRSSLTLPLSLWFILFFINGLNAALEPSTGAVCQDNFGWMNNSRTQSPCLIAAYLEGACGTGYWNIPALPSGNTYDGPNENQTNLCLCSSVVYTAVSACAACQGEAWVTWPVWKLECDPTVVTVANYKFDIPPGTAIPRWMYQDPTQQLGVSFNNTLAFSVAGQRQPDVTSSNGALASGTTSAATPTATATAAAGTSSANIGAIVGGVVGGLGFLTAGLILGWWFLRKRHSTRSSQAPSKQYIAKWSKEVPVGHAPSRGGGTSYGSDSVMGDPAKDRDMMMSPTSTLPASYTPDGHKSPYDGQRRNRSFESAQPHQPVMYFPSSPPSSYPAKRSGTQGHKKDHSGSSSFSKKLLGIPSTADNITPFFLPPVETTVTSDPEIPFSPSRSDGRSSSAGYSAEQQSTRTRSSKPSRKQKTPVLAEPLPSTIEYFRSKPPPLTNNTATTVTSAPSAVPYGRSSNEGNRSRSSFTGSRAGYYNPDDPATYPVQMDPYGRPPSSRRTSADQLPGPAQVSQPAWPDAASEKAALASRDYTPLTMPTPGHSGYAHSASHDPRQFSSPPIPSTSPYGIRSPMESPSQSPQPTQPLVGASLGLTNSVHTIQGFDEPELEHEQPRRHAPPGGPVPAQQHHQRQDSSEAESAGAAGNGFFSSIGRRVRPGGRSNESNNSQAPPPAPAQGRQWSIHVRNSQFEADEFNPYRGS